jgi:hypothetical protein
MSFNPDQPRDYHGRWGDGSGSPASATGHANSVAPQSRNTPLQGHPYHQKTDAQLRYIAKDASEAAKAMQGHSPRSEAKYLDQVNDASTVLGYRQRQNDNKALAAFANRGPIFGRSRRP